MEYTLRNRPELLKAYRDGSWEIMAGADIVIKRAWVENSDLNHFYNPVKKVITCDPAKYGDDETVIYAMKNTDIVKSPAPKIFGKKDEYYIANEMEIMGT